jgi:hypothetical protein
LRSRGDGGCAEFCALSLSLSLCLSAFDLSIKLAEEHRRRGELELFSSLFLSLSFARARVFESFD